jgi:hypothetical protein
MMLRGDVEEATFNALPEDIEIRYSTRPVDIWQNASCVRALQEVAESARALLQEHIDALVASIPAIGRDERS